MSVKITDEMRNAFYSKAEVQRTGAIRYLDEALEAALSAHTAEKGEAEPVGYTGQYTLDELARGAPGNIYPNDVEGYVALYAHPPAPRDDLVAEVERLKTTIRNTRSIVSEGAVTGFNPLDGDWAERIYSNQAALSAALEGRTDA